MLQATCFLSDAGQVLREASNLLPAMRCETPCLVDDACRAMKRRDLLYSGVRQAIFGDAGSKYYRELSIDELPGITSMETLLCCLQMCKS